MDQTGKPSTLDIQARLSAISVILHVLVGRLQLNGLLDTADLVAMRALAVRVAEDMQRSGATPAQIGGARLNDEIESWFAALD